jgi:hypothetical protein
MFLRMGVSKSTRGSQEPRHQVLGKVPLIADQFAKEALSQFGHRAAIIERSQE